MRVFTGLLLPQEIAEAAEKDRESFDPFGRSIRWVRSRTIHLTLHFFPDLPDPRVEELKRITADVLLSRPAFQVQLKGPGFFPPEGDPRILWWGIEPCQALDELHQDLTDAYRKNHYELEERGFKPHITLGRFHAPLAARPELTALEERWGLKGKHFQPEQLYLFQSPSGPEGYPILHEFHFRS